MDARCRRPVRDADRRGTRPPVRRAGGPGGRGQRPGRLRPRRRRRRARARADDAPAQRRPDVHRGDIPVAGARRPRRGHRRLAHRPRRDRRDARDRAPGRLRTPLEAAHGVRDRRGGQRRRPGPRGGLEPSRGAAVRLVRRRWPGADPRRPHSAVRRGFLARARGPDAGPDGAPGRRQRLRRRRRRRRVRGRRTHLVHGVPARRDPARAEPSAARSRARPGTARWWSTCRASSTRRGVGRWAPVEYASPQLAEVLGYAARGVGRDPGHAGRSTSTPTTWAASSRTTTRDVRARADRRDGPRVPDAPPRRPRDLGPRPRGARQRRGRRARTLARLPDRHHRAQAARGRAWCASRSTTR